MAAAKYDGILKSDNAIEKLMTRGAARAASEAAAAAAPAPMPERKSITIYPDDEKASQHMSVFRVQKMDADPEKAICCSRCKVFAIPGDRMIELRCSLPARNPPVTLSNLLLCRKCFVGIVNSLMVVDEQPPVEPLSSGKGKEKAASQD